MDEASFDADIDQMCEMGYTMEKEEAKDDLLVRSYNTRSSSGRPAVNSPATHGPV